MLYFWQNMAVRRKFFTCSGNQEALSVSGWLCMVMVILLLMAGSRWLCPERKQIFLYGVLFFCTRDMGRLITESLYYLFNGMLVL